MSLFNPFVNNNSNKRRNSVDMANSNKFIILPNNVEAPSVSAIPTMNTDRQSRLPPITVFGKTPMEIRNKLVSFNNIKMENLLIKSTQFGIKIFVKNNTDYKFIKALYEKEKTEFFTHPTNDEKYIKVCLYGLWKMTNEELIRELDRYKLKPKEIKVLEQKLRKFEDQVIYILHFKKSDGIKMSQLRNIKALYNCIVRWQYYSPKNKGPTQCTNCLAFGHGGRNCFRKPNCIRCGDKHESIKCPLLLDIPGGNNSKIPDDKVKCANCQGRHTANFKGCPARQEFLQIQANISNRPRAEPKEKQRHFKLNNADFPPLNTGNKILPNMTFSEASGISRPDDLFSAAQCSAMMVDLLRRLSGCKNKFQQIQAITDFTLQYLYGNK